MTADIGRLAKLVTIRATNIRQAMAITNSVGGSLRAALGWHPGLPKAESRKIADRAARIIAAVKSGKPPRPEDAELAGLWKRSIVASMDAAAPFDPLRKEAEDAIEKLARGLPGYDFVKTVRGFGDLTFGIIVGHCRGDNDNGLSDFPTKSKMWKRLGLGFANADESEVAERQKHKKRRAAVYVGIYDAMLRAQWCGEGRAYREAIAAHPEAAAKAEQDNLTKPDELKALADSLGIVAQAHALGPYGEAYGAAKAKYMPRVAATAHLPMKIGVKVNPDKWTPKRADTASRRYMAKQVLRDLWRAWNADVVAREIGASEAIAEVPQGHPISADGAPNQTEAAARPYPCLSGCRTQELDVDGY